VRPFVIFQNLERSPARIPCSLDPMTFSFVHNAWPKLDAVQRVSVSDHSYEILFLYRFSLWAVKPGPSRSTLRLFSFVDQAYLPARQPSCITPTECFLDHRIESFERVVEILYRDVVLFQTRSSHAADPKSVILMPLHTLYMFL
jgi:hypothetical protein